MPHPTRRPSRLGSITLLATALLLAGASAAHANGTCEAGRHRAAGKYAACMQKAFAARVSGGNYSFSKCRLKYAATWARLAGQALGGGGMCDAPRFVDNGDGTVTDHLTALQWEKKTHPDGTPNPTDPHDADNTYSWSIDNNIAATDGTAFTEFLPALTVGCFAGQCDWRLPTLAEVLTILTEPSICHAPPCIDPTFGPTAAHNGYWTATDYGSGLTWVMFFGPGGPYADGATDPSIHARAVRGGL